MTKTNDEVENYNNNDFLNMKNIMKHAASVALLLGVSTAAVAQNNNEFKPYWFAGVQGGAQVTFTNYKIDKLITPQYALQAGRWFAPQFGVRAHIMGYETKGGFPEGLYSEFGQKNPALDYTFKALTGDIDFLFNMTNILAPNRQCHKWNWNLIGGFGINYTFDYDNYKSLVAQYSPYYGDQVLGTKSTNFNGRLGTQVEYEFSPSFAINLELQANYKNDLYNLKVNDHLDWQAAALIGVTYKFGRSKAKPVEVVAEPEPIYETRVDTVWYDDVAYKSVPAPEKIERNIHYSIRKSDPVSEKMIREISDFVKSHKDVKVSVTGYADKGTGNARINMKYSQQRAEAVTKALTEAGVPAEIITTEWKGDTVQPFAENDENRVAITVATGMGEKKEKETVKKYRLEEKRVRIN